MSLSFRTAVESDLPQIIKLLCDDELGKSREEYTIPLKQCYIDAFKEISNDKNNDIIVAVLSNKIVGCFQITYTTYLSRKGGKRATVESVRVSSDMRSNRIGSKMLEHAIDLAKKNGCFMVQLTTDKTRTRAHKFYKKLGFTASHEGMKLIL